MAPASRAPRTGGRARAGAAGVRLGAGDRRRGGVRARHRPAAVWPGTERPGTGATAPASAPLASTAPTSAYDDTVAVLDENPDLYLWLASNDEPMPVLE